MLHNLFRFVMEYFQISEAKNLSNSEKRILEALDYTTKFSEVKDYLENIEYTLSTNRVYTLLSGLEKKGIIRTERDLKISTYVHYIKIEEYN